MSTKLYTFFLTQKVFVITKNSTIKTTFMPTEDHMWNCNLTNEIAENTSRKYYLCLPYHTMNRIAELFCQGDRQGRWCYECKYLGRSHNLQMSGMRPVAGQCEAAVPSPFLGLTKPLSLVTVEWL